MSRRLWLLAAGQAALGIFALAALLWLAELDGATLRETLGRPGVPAWAGLVALTWVQIACGAEKWKRVMARIAPAEADPMPTGVPMLVTALVAVVAVVLPLYAAAPVVRGLAQRMIGGGRFVHGAAGSMYEQAFDVAVLLAMTGPGALALLGLVDATTWAAASAAALVAVGGAAWLIAGGLGRWLAHETVPSEHLGGGRLRRLRTLPGAWARLGLLDRRLVLTLYGLSVMRYGAMLGRAGLVVWAAGLPVTVPDAAVGFAVVQSLQILSLTPGGLGVIEWGWTGALMALDHPAVVGVQTGLTMRALNTAAYTIVLVLAWGWWWGRRGRRAPRVPRR